MGSKSWLLLIALALVGGLLLRLPWSGRDVVPVGLVTQPQANANDGAAVAPEGSGGVAPVPIDREPAAAPAGAPAAPALHGVVEEVGGEAIAGATVAVFGGSVRDDAAALATAETDGGGRFRIPTPRGAGPWTVRATAANYQSTTASGVDAEQSVRLQLRRVVEVFGRVLVRSTGVPIAGATVYDDRTVVESDHLGRYRLTAVMLRGLAVLTAKAEGFADHTEFLQLHEPTRTELDLRLSPTAPMRVQVIDRENGTPIAGAEVRRFRGGDPFGHSDADGHLVIDVGEGQELTLFVDADGYCPLGWHWMVAGGALPAPRLPLSRTGHIEGVLTDADGRPQSDILVRHRVEGARTADRPWTRDEMQQAQVPGVLTDPRMYAEARSDEHGRFVMAVRAGPEPHLLSATAIEGAVAESAPFLLTTPGETVRVDLSFRLQGSIRGTAICNGKPWVGRVSWSQQGGGSGQSSLDGEGQYVLQAVPAGLVEVRVVEPPGNHAVQVATVQVVAGHEVRHDFTWQQRRASIRGRLLDASGQPVVGFRMVAFRAGPDGRRSFDARTDADGRYTIDVPDDGVFTVSVQRGSLSHSREGVPPRATDIDFVLPELGTLRLRLIDAATQGPVHITSLGLFTVAWRQSGASVFQMIQATVDRAGLVVLGVPVGMVDISVHLGTSGYAPRQMFGLVVTTDERPAEVRVELTAGVDLRLAVTGAMPFRNKVHEGHVLFVLEDAQVASVRGPFVEQGGDSNLRIQDVNMWLAEPGLMNLMPRFDEDARATVTGLLPGRYRLVAFPDDLVFEPSTFAVGPGDTDVELRWWRR